MPIGPKPRMPVEKRSDVAVQIVMALKHKHRYVDDMLMELMANYTTIDLICIRDALVHDKENGGVK